MDTDLQQRDHVSNPSGLRRRTPSQDRLEALKFDPIDVQVDLYNKLVKEAEYQERIRKGEIMYMNYEGKLKPLKYSAVAHMNVLSQVQKCAAELTRYKYGRVPESLEIEVKKAAGLTIILSDEDYKEVNNDEF